MARAPQEREDLLRDATALVDRVELQVGAAKNSAIVFAGFRVGGAASFYFDQDPVYHFNNDHKLRRAHVDNELIKAEQGRLVALRRQQFENEVAMIRYVMQTDKQDKFCQTALKNLSQLCHALTAEDYTIMGQVSAVQDRSVVDQLITYLTSLQAVTVAASPRVSG